MIAEGNTSEESAESAEFALSSLTSSLTIGFDGKRAAHNYTGLGNYSRYIIRILSEYFPVNKYKVYSTQAIRSRQDDSAWQNHPSVSFAQPKQKRFKSLWRSYGIIKDLKRDGIDIYHGLSNEIPFGIQKSGIRSVVTIHDLIFLRFPEYYPAFDRKMYQLKFRYACKKADKIIAIDVSQKPDDILEFLKLRLI